MLNEMKKIAALATNTTSIEDEDKENLRTIFQKYFIEADGKRFSPFAENKMKKPAKKLRSFLENLGFDLIKCVLNQCEYELTIVTSYGENFYSGTIIIDYWNRNVRWDTGIRF